MANQVPAISNCGVEDFIRYAGSAAGIGGSIYYWEEGSTVPAVLLGISGVAIIVVHVMDKTCGALPKTINAFKEALKNYGLTLSKEGQVVGQLDNDEKEWEGDEKGLDIEIQTLSGSTQKVQAAASAVGIASQQITQETAQLQKTIQDLQARTEQQAKTIASLTGELKVFQEQNQSFQGEIQKAAAILPNLERDNQALEQTSRKIETDLGSFDQRIQDIKKMATTVKDLSAQNDSLKRDLSNLRSQIQRFERAESKLAVDVKQIASSEKSTQGTVQELVQIQKKLEAERGALEVLRAEIAKEAERLRTANGPVSGNESISALLQGLSQFNQQTRQK